MIEQIRDIIVEDELYHKQYLDDHYFHQSIKALEYNYTTSNIINIISKLCKANEDYRNELAKEKGNKYNQIFITKEDYESFSK